MPSSNKECVVNIIHEEGKCYCDSCNYQQICHYKSCNQKCKYKACHTGVHLCGDKEHLCKEK